MQPPLSTQISERLRRLERLCWLVALVLGLLQAWGRRHASAEGLRYIGADSISYLDLGDAWLRGDWAHAINAMWSPFYSWLLGLTLRLFRPTAYQEFTTARLLNFAIYTLALAAFTFCLHTVLHARRARITAERAQGRATEPTLRTHTSTLLPDYAVLLVGYACFIWTALVMNRVARISPDLLVSVWVYLTAGLLLRARAGDLRWLDFALLGLVLGVGYLTKTIMCPLGFVWLACAVFAIKPRRRSVPRVLVALLVFLCVAMPFVVALSLHQHRLTIGDSARLNYAWYVNRITPFTHWQGEPTGSGTPAHPTRQIFIAPNVYEFATPVGGTYPPWYDPTFWYAGVTPHFNLRQQARAVARNLYLLARFIGTRIFLLAALVGLAILFYFGRRGRMFVGDVTMLWLVSLPSLIACSLYLLINVEARYLAPFFTLIGLSLFACVRLPETLTAQRLARATVAVILLACALSLAPDAARDAYATARDLFTKQSATDDVQWQIADELNRRGVRPGAQVAIIGDAMYAAWPRLARVRVVAELPVKPDGNVAAFWTADEARKQQIIAAFAHTGAQIIVAQDVPQGVATDGWQRIDQTNHYIYFLMR
jgi:hypothetical protein